MDLSQLVYNRLASDETLQKMLAKYDGQPAIFNTEFPSDQQEGWDGKTQYPRIEYQFNMQVDTQRASSGMLMLAIYTEKNPMVAEQLEMCVRRSLKDVLMMPSSEAPFCVAWARTDPFMLEGNAILCKDLVFDILEYPDQETTDPDPVMALSKYIKELYPDCIVLGMDRIGEYTNPADTPIFYCRLQNIALDPTGYLQHTITWFNCQIAVHLLCPDSAMRLKLIAGLNQMLGNAGEVIMLDDSPMTINAMQVNNRADYLREGQLLITGHYGCLKDSYVGKGLRKVTITDH